MATHLVDRFALGDLTQVFPPELVDVVLAKTRDREVRVRLLPPRLTAYFVLARALFCPEPYREVLRTLAEAARREDDGGQWRVPDKAAIFRARRALGVEPFRDLLVHAGTAVADERTPGAFWRGLRLMVVDGTTLPAADTEANEAGLGRPRPRPGKGPTGYPLVRLAVLIEAGTHVVTDAVVDSYRVQERALVERLAPSLGPGMLVLADRGLPGAHLWQRAEARGAHLLWRVPGTWKLPVEDVLADGSWLSTVRGGRGRRVRPPQDARVRVIEYGLDVSGRTERYRLITTLLDPDQAPAAELAALYSERWEVENSLAELKTTQIGAGTVLPSKSPALVLQEVYAHLAVYTGLRVLMHAVAVGRGEPLDPDRLSFAATLRAVRRSVTAFPGNLSPLPPRG
ncbi:IS4 family transposase [Pseudofrankia sp. BMG5.37]|uniref:IS4 family transposase n=1 Tax=Pseudofrankia sp. BMG5.37 TaxID=3050035 RepID=UPI002893CDA6|nr:IS4 family transposase [Pseudofrankia sp. BMG5.37]MDT3444104.1 IS4 family transposase [Pseudofrankia sp. BMG5.37]MDT3446626.1 IS4 family transposase [Pseudofrankia sp. BMG5.37]MDT3447003.1 IS4 family transposase [Pseudofrankia sp. BMG5.37]MDT3447009.1 IS4 family transposase [Pseudofrankia sp. BMG5.37]